MDKTFFSYFLSRSHTTPSPRGWKEWGLHILPPTPSNLEGELVRAVSERDSLLEG